MEQEIAVGLDIGTTKVCAIVASRDETHPGRMKILGIGKSPSEGLTRGVVTNIEKTVKSIEAAVADAEAQSGVKINAVTVGIAGDHIQSFTSRGVVTINRPESEITQEDVDRLIEDTKRVALPLDRKIIHVLPQQFIVDGQDGVYDPVGMSGVRMEAMVHVITGLVSATQNIYRCVQRARLQVNDIVLEPLASSHAVLNDEEKEVGVAILDIGGGTTDLAVFEERTIRHTAVIGIAGKKVTDDIRKGFGILGDQAERLKIEYGFAYEPAVTDNSPILLPGIGGREANEIDKLLLCRVIQPRMEEILEFAGMEIKRSGFSRNLHAGVVLTGGGSLIKGTKELAHKVLGMPVKIGIPGGFSSGLVREVENPIYATGVGLVLHELKHRGPTTVKQTLKDGKKKSILARMGEWFDQL